MTIVRTSYRYKRPPRKRKAVALGVPAIVTAKSKRPYQPPATAPEPPVIVTARKPGRRASPFGNAPDLTEEERNRRADLADELFRRFKREIAASKR